MIEVFDLSRATDLDKQKLPIQTVDGYAPDANGNVDTKRLPLSGGKITGRLYFNCGVLSSTNNEEYKETWLSSGDVWGQGGLITLYHKDSPNALSGGFSLSATDGGNWYHLTGTPDGTLLWRGSEVLLPVGSVFAFAANSVPYGCLLCNGAAVSRTTYAKLFSVIGTTYGSGDGSTTFNLPNLTDRFIQGSGTAGTVKSAGVPEIKGTFQTGGFNESGAVNGAFGVYYSGGDGLESASRGQFKTVKSHDFYASRCSGVYRDDVDTVQPPALTMRYYIKY